MPGSVLAQSRRGYARPSPLVADLIVTAVSERGEHLGSWDFGALSGALAVRSSLATAFAQAVDVGGPWRSKATIGNAFTGVSHFLRWFNEHGRRIETLGALTPAAWGEYVLALPPSVAAGRLGLTRQLLRASNELTPAALRAVNTRAKSYQRPPQPSLTTAQVKTIKRIAHAIVADAHRRILAGWQHLEDYRAGACKPGSDDERWGKLLAHAEEHLDLPRLPGSRKVVAEAHRLLGSGESIRVLERLFLRADEATAAMVLLALYEGWNPGVILGLTAAGIKRADDGVGAFPPE